MHDLRLTFLRFVFLSVLIGLSFSQPTIAQLPSPPKGVSGYTVSLQEHWVSPYQGYRPVRVTIETNPANAVVEDERFTASITFHRRSAGSYVVSAPIMIPLGKKSGTVEFYVSATNSVDAYSSEVLVEKGEYDGEFNGRDVLSTNSTATTTSYGWQPTRLMISSSFSEPMTRKWVCYKRQMKDAGQSQPNFNSPKTLPSFDQQEQVFGDQSLGVVVPTQPVIGNIGTANKLSPASVIAQNHLLHGVHPDFLPESWIGLTGVEEILVSMDDLKSITQKENVRNNLEKWLAAGGVLIVFDTGPKFKKAKQILPLLVGPERLTNSNNASSWSVANEKVVKLDRLITAVNGRGGYYYGQQTGWYDPSESMTIAEKIGEFPEFDDPASIPGTSKFGISEYLNGRVVAVSDDMSQWKIPDWQVLYNTLATDGRNIRQRIGVATGVQPLLAFKIPGVGEPPIVAFQVLISLFLLVAGPVVLLILKRTEQMQYFFVAVPLLSLGVCTALLSYAVLVDGSKRWGRTQSVTTMDHRTNMAVTHARAMYYTGSRPKTYEFENDTFSATPVTAASEVLYSRSGPGKQTLSGGEIRPRNPHEVISVRSHVTRQRLMLLPNSDAADKNPAPSIENRLGAQVLLAVVKTEDGLFFVENLDSEQSARTGKIILADAQQKIRDTLKTMSPQRIDTRVYRGAAVSYNNEWGEEIRVVEALRISDLSEFLEKPNTYVAILEQFPLVSAQIEPVEYKMQLHVVRGQW